MWIFLWAVLSLFVLGIFVWSLQILLQQKKTWKAFAKRHNIVCQDKKLMESPVLQGRVSGYQTYIYSRSEATADGRGQRFSTVIEIEIGHGFPTGGLIGAKEFADLVANVNFPETIVIDFPGWDSSRIVRTRNAEKMRAYMTQDRLEAVNNIMTMKNALALYFFDENNGAFRIETSDPLRDLERMEKVMKRIVAAMDKMKLPVPADARPAT